MRRRFWIVATLPAAVLLAACGQAPAGSTRLPAPAPTTTAAALTSSGQSTQKPDELGPFTRSGGLTGETVRMTVMSDGTIKLSNGGPSQGETRIVKLSPDAIRPLRDAISNPEWQNMAGRYGEQSPDAYAYEIDAGGKRVVTYDGANTPPALQTVLKAFGDLLAVARKAG